MKPTFVALSDDFLVDEIVHLDLSNPSRKDLFVKTLFIPSRGRHSQAFASEVDTSHDS